MRTLPDFSRNRSCRFQPEVVGRILCLVETTRQPKPPGSRKPSPRTGRRSWPNRWRDPVPETLGGLRKYHRQNVAREPSTGDETTEASDCRTRRAMETASKPPVHRATTITFGRDTNSDTRSKPDCQRAFRSFQFFDRACPSNQGYLEVTLKVLAPYPAILKDREPRPCSASLTPLQ